MSPQAVLIQPGATALTRTSGARLSGQAPGERQDRPLGRGEELARVPLHAGLGLVPAHRHDRARRPAAFIRRPTSRQSRIVATTSTAQSRSSLASKGSFAAGAGQGVGPGEVEPGVEPAPERPRRRRRAGRPRRGRRGRPSGPRTGRPGRRTSSATASAGLARAPAVDDHVGPGLGQGQGRRPGRSRRSSRARSPAVLARVGLEEGSSWAEGRGQVGLNMHHCRGPIVPPQGEPASLLRPFGRLPDLHGDRRPQHPLAVGGRMHPVERELGRRPARP